MDEKIIKLGDALMALTTFEAVELQKYLESKGLSFASAQPTATAAAPAEKEIKESANVNVVLTQSASLIKLAKALMPRTGKNAAGIKELTQNLPSIVMENMPREEAKSLLSELANELPPEEYVFELQDC